FFLDETPPNDALVPKKPAWICQRFNNQFYFATLYDRDLRIPVYSAYRYQPGNDTRPGKVWMVEPQLIGPDYPNAMEKETTLIKTFNVSLEQVKESQAVTEDYENLKGLKSGHLNPTSHQPSFKSKKATFTLTNIIPQNEKLDNGAWNEYEVQVMMNKTKHCTTTYVVVGTVPGDTSIANGRVNIPSYLWSGACCEMGMDDGRKAWGVIAENNKNAIQVVTLGQLEDKLTKLYNRGDVSLFHPDCPRE
ncbi:ENDD1 protein, partial [Pedionomus torquatus]|nr:ENDD1 protein [Pedionomus torquatus]